MFSTPNHDGGKVIVIKMKGKLKNRLALKWWEVASPLSCTFYPVSAMNVPTIFSTTNYLTHTYPCSMPWQFPWHTSFLYPIFFWLSLSCWHLPFLCFQLATTLAIDIPHNGCQIRIGLKTKKIWKFKYLNLKKIWYANSTHYNNCNFATKAFITLWKMNGSRKIQRVGLVKFGKLITVNL